MTSSCWDIAGLPKPGGQQRRNLRLNLLRANSFLQRTQQLFSGLAAAQRDPRAAEEGDTCARYWSPSPSHCNGALTGEIRGSTLPENRGCRASGPTGAGRAVAVNSQAGGDDSQEPPRPWGQKVSLHVPAGRQSQSCEAAAETWSLPAFL